MNVFLAMLFVFFSLPQNVESQQQFLETQINQTVLEAQFYVKEIERPYLCFCVTTARILGLNVPLVPSADHLKPNIDVPAVGDGILLQYATLGHLALIKMITDEGYWIAEGNYKKCAYTERFILKNDYRIIGFYHGQYE